MTRCREDIPATRFQLPWSIEFRLEGEAERELSLPWVPYTDAQEAVEVK